MAATERFVSEDDWFWSDPEIDLSYSVAHHVCAEDIEQAGQPNKSGLVAVTIHCRCGKHLRTYIDSVI